MKRDAKSCLRINKEIRWANTFRNVFMKARRKSVQKPQNVSIKSFLALFRLALKFKTLNCFANIADCFKSAFAGKRTVSFLNRDFSFFVLLWVFPLCNRYVTFRNKKPKKNSQLNWNLKLNFVKKAFGEKVINSCQKTQKIQVSLFSLFSFFSRVLATVKLHVWQCRDKRCRDVFVCRRRLADALIMSV